MVPSHEPVGTIAAVGTKAQAKWKAGQRVGAILFQRQCHNCLTCETVNDIRFCENVGFAGLKMDGGMAQYMLSDADSIMELPDSISFEQGAPLMCAGISEWRHIGVLHLLTDFFQATVWGGICTAAVPAGEAIGIVGIGGSGSLAAEFAKALGYRAVAIDNRTEGLELAQELTLKADLAVDFNDSEAATKIRAWAGKGGLAAIIVCTDNLPAILWSTKALRTRGTVVNIGLPTTPIGFDSFDIVFQEKTIKGSLVANVAMVKDMLKVVEAFCIRSHITTVPFEDAPKLPYMYMDPHLKGRLVMKGLP
jgi:D-arabinose 1-dehydrogenase-like Zn-dependent alcohol dehydrogenase